MKTIQISKLKPKGISFKKIKHKKRIVFILLIVAACVAVGVNVAKPKSKMVMDYSQLKKDNIVKSVNTVGKIESNNKVNVYSTLNNVIKEVKVSAGDKVNAGDVLCILDSSALEREISEAEAEVKYNKDKAKVDLDGKKQSYNNAISNVETSIKDSEAAVNTAKIKLDDAQREYNNQKALYEGGAVEKEKLNTAESALKSAQNDYDKSLAELENAKVKAQQDVDNAKYSYDSASVELSNNKADITLQNKKDDLGKCVITAPVSGTVTTVNASVGNAAGGVLFVIEDLEDPIITVDIKEIDVNKIQPDQEVEITTDATEDGDFASGKVISLSDTVSSQGGEIQASANSNNNSGNGGSTQSSSSTFEAKIKLDNPLGNDDIKVGMSAKAKIILDKRDDVFSVPFSSILEEDDGKYIEILKEAENGQYQVRKIQVETGLETDAAVEINSGELNEGDNLIMEPSSYNDGELVMLASSSGGSGNE